jgi:hypothetical protein
MNNSMKNNTLKPSNIFDQYWLYAHNKTNNITIQDSFVGKWMLFVLNNDMDNIWDIIKNETENGNLGISSKIATMKNNPNTLNNSYKVICVYTYDYSDKDNVEKIGKKLIELLNLNKPIYYKTDQQTIENNYRIKGSKKASLYRLKPDLKKLESEY